MFILLRGGRGGFYPIDSFWRRRGGFGGGRKIAIE